MGMMKGNVAMMVPQTLIMGWINAFFAGFVLCKSRLSHGILEFESVRGCWEISTHPFNGSAFLKRTATDDLL